MIQKTGFCFFICVLFLLVLPGCNHESISISTQIPTTTPIPSSTIVPIVTDVPTETSTPVSVAVNDLGSALISPADSKMFDMDYGPMDTWVDDEGMHAALESYYQDGPGVRMSLDCGDAPYTGPSKDIGYMSEIPVDFIYGNETHAYVHEDDVFLYFLEKNYRVEIWMKPVNNGEEDLQEKTMRQIYGMAEIITERLQEVVTNEGLKISSIEVVPGLEEEIFYDIDIWRWGEDFRSYSISLDTKRVFIDKSTFAIYDIGKQKFIFRRDVPNYPPMGMSLLDNLGETVGMNEPVKTMTWESNYELWIWVEDELVGVYPLDKYEQP